MRYMFLIATVFLVSACSSAQIVEGDIKACDVTVVETGRATSLGLVNVYSVDMSTDYESGLYVDVMSLRLNDNGYEYSSDCTVTVGRDGMEYAAHGCQNDDPSDTVDCSLQYTEISGTHVEGRLRCNLTAETGEVVPWEWEFSYDNCVVN